MIRNTWWELVAVALLAFAAGAWTMHKDQHPAQERPAPAVRQTDGSLILERNPATPPPAAPKIPHGSKVTRITTVQAEPLDPIHPVTIHLTQIQTEDGSRVVASSPDGRILEGSDWTVGPPARTYRWQIQAVRAWDDGGRRGRWGGSVGYTRGPFLGTLTVLPGQLQVGIGLRW